MTTETTAQLLIQHINKPCLYIREITDMTGLSNTNISGHEKRGNIKLVHTPPESRGRGAKILYPFSDLIEIIALAELVRANQPTQINGEPIAFKLSNVIFRQLNGLAYPDKEYPVAVPGGGTKMCKAADSRYAVLFESKEDSRIDIQTNTEPEPPLRGDGEGFRVWWVMDCLEVALDLVRFFDAHRHLLAR